MAFTRYKNRRGLAAEWAFHNPILADGELGFEKDTNFVKIGDGSTNWVNLPYLKGKDLLDHLSDTSDAHDASAISFTAFGQIQATDVQVALEMLETEKSPTAHTHPVVAAGVKSTVGAGLPLLSSGKLVGDLHYNITDKKEYVVSGVIGTSGNDTFTRADGNLAGTVTETGAKTWVNDAGVATGPTISGNKVIKPAAAAAGAVLLNLGAEGQYLSAEFTYTAAAAPDVYLRSALSGPVSNSYRASFQSNSGAGNGAFRILRNNVVVASITLLPSANYPAGTYILSMEQSSTTGIVTAKVTGPGLGVGETLTYTDATPLTGTYAGFGVSANDGAASVDNVVFGTLGSLTWTSTDEFVATHTHSGTKNTIGSPLPAFVGRQNGDIHYETVLGRDYVHTGSPGVAVTDNFDRPNASLIGQTTTTGGKTWVVGGGNNNGVSIFNGQARGTLTNGFSGVALIDTGSSASQYLRATVDGTLSPSNNASLVLGATTANIDTLMKFQYFPGGTGPGSYYFLIGGVAQHPGSGQSFPAGVLQGKIHDVVMQFDATAKTYSLSVDGILVRSGTFTQTPGQFAGMELNRHDTNGYVTVDNFEATNIGTLAWTDMSTKGVTPIITQGTTFPSLTDRKNNDLHYLTTSARGYIHTGSPAPGFVSEDFAGVSGVLLHLTSTELGSKVWTADDTIKFQGDGTAGATFGGSASAQKAYINFGSDAQDITAVFAANSPTSGPSNHGIMIANTNIGVGGGPINHGLYLYGGSTTNSYTLEKRDAANGTTPVFTAAVDPGRPVKWRVRRTAAGLVTLWLNDVQVYEGSPAGTYGNLCGFTLTGLNTTTRIESFTVGDLGTLAWSALEPIYLQAQLATGNVATGTNVLKPGLRVPAASTLAELVLRAETAPVGAPITVAVERFNNGVSAGVIGTVSIPTGENVGSTVGLTSGCAKGDILKFNITSVGSTTAGADLTISLDLR